MKWGWTLVMLAVYYGTLGLILNGMAGAVNEYNTLDNGTIPVDYEPDDVFTGEMREWYEEMSSNFEQMEQNTWPGDNMEVGLSDRIEIKPVYHATEDYSEYPSGDWIFEPDSFQSFFNQWFAGGGNWQMKYEYWDYGNRMNMSPGEEVWIYPHIYYNSPGIYFGGEVTDTAFLTVWGFDATRGKAFENVYELETTGMESGYAYSKIYKFYANEMTNHDLQYVIDVAVLKEPGLADAAYSALKGGMSYQQIENMYDCNINLEERYCGVIYGEKGRADYWHNAPQGTNIPHTGYETSGGAFKWLRDAITGFAFLTSDEVPMPIAWLARILVFGPLGVLLGYVIWTEVRSLIPFISGG
jgi:hypothetical protein